MKTNHSPEEVAEAIRTDIIKARRITLSDAARKLGKSPNNIYNILNGKSRISRSIANQFHQEFGYSVEFLTMGEGELYENTLPVRELSKEEVEGQEENPYDAIYYMTDADDFTPRERVLNNFARALSIIYGEASRLIPGTIRLERGAEFIDLVDNQFTAKTKREQQLMNAIQNRYSDLRELIDLERILNEVNALEK